MEARLSNRNARSPGPGLLPLLQAVAAGDTRFEVDSLAPGVVKLALENGLGAILARVSRDSPAERTIHAHPIQAAEPL